MGFFDKLKSGLTKTRKGLVEKITNIMPFGRKIDEEFFEELEEILIQSDVGVNTTLELIDELRDRVKKDNIETARELQQVMQELISEMMLASGGIKVDSNELSVILVVGVNGVGKTTSIGKLAAQLKAQGKNVILGAGDTFRAAAIDQLEIWGNRVGVDVIKHQEGADPAAVAYDAVHAAKSRKADVLIIDTAGRLHNKAGLMGELSKVVRVIQREIPNAPQEVLLVLDATTGQNAIQQAKIFSDATGVTGIVLTKLDGTAKGGVIIAINNELRIPVKFVGVGEGVDDLQPFMAEDFAKALFGDLDIDEKEGEES